MPEPFDPLSPDAPIQHWLSLQSNPNVATCSDDELRALIQRLRTYATSAPTLSAKIKSDSDVLNPRKRTKSAEALRRAALLAEI